MFRLIQTNTNTEIRVLKYKEVGEGSGWRGEGGGRCGGSGERANYYPTRCSNQQLLGSPVTRCSTTVPPLSV